MKSSDELDSQGMKQANTRENVCSPELFQATIDGPVESMAASIDGEGFNHYELYDAVLQEMNQKLVVQQTNTDYLCSTLGHFRQWHEHQESRSVARSRWSLFKSPVQRTRKEPDVSPKSIVEAAEVGADADFEMTFEY